MKSLHRITATAVVGLGMAVVGTPATSAQTPAPAGPGSGPPQFRSVEHTARSESFVSAEAKPAHPLQQALDLAQASLAQVSQVRDYAFTFVKREEVDGKLNSHEAMFMKIRNQPFSVYVYTLGPTQDKGQEAIYVEGRNEGKILVHVVGFRHKLVGMLSLAPDSPEVMAGNRYSITSAGFKNMLEKVVRMYQNEMTQGESAVQIIPGAKVDGRACTCVQVSHPAPRPNFIFQMTRMFYDSETNLPLRWEAYGFPTRAGEAPPLVEEYTYRNVQVNVGMTDADFDPNNPQYGYR